jgi:hypothetical protein
MCFVVMREAGSKVVAVSSQVDRGNLTAERIASIKVGFVSGGTITIACCGIALLQGWGLGEALEFWELGWNALLAGVSGFLFGITYRHIIRHDRDDHLQSGAVGAFGLVRGLAMLPVPQFERWEPWLMAGLTLGESLLLFSLGRLVLDWCFGQGWVQRFPIK